MRKSIILSAVLAGAVTVFGLHNSVEATSDLESERNSISDERSDVQSELSDAEQDLADLMNEIDAIEEQIASIEDGLQGNQEQMDATEADIKENEEKKAELQEEIEALEADIEERFELLKNRASSYQRNGGATSSYLEVILGSEGFSDFISRVLTISQIARADNDFIDALELKQQELEDVQQVFQDTLDHLDEQMVELEGIKQYMEEQRQQQETLRADVEEKREDLEDMIANLESQEAELAREESALMARIEAERERQRAEREASQQASQSNSSQATAAAPASNSSQSSAPSPTPSHNVSASGSASTVINAGTHYIGNSSYVFGGGRSQSDVAAGRFDCSGYVSWAFRQIGVSLPTSTDAILHSGQRISASQMRPGDLVFFDTYKRNGHVGIYAGNGRFIGSQSSTGVAFANMTSGYWANNFRGVVVRVLH